MRTMSDVSAWPPAANSNGAPTPEELERLLEDTLVLRDPQALATLFEAGAVLAAGANRMARGGEAIARLALTIWEVEHNYVAAPHCVLQARDVALIVARQGVQVMRRGSDGAWRYAILHTSLRFQGEGRPE